jgi:hypothetical protein
MVNRIPDTMGLIIPAILPNAEAVPTAVPRTSVVNTSGVYPYMTAYNKVAKNDTADDESNMVTRELMTEKINKAPEDPNAESAMVPLRPSLVSIIQDAIYVK